MQRPITARTQLLELYATALERVRGEEAVYQALMQEGSLPACHVVALGKAAEAMYQGVHRYLDGEIKSALLISKYGHFSAELRSNRQLTVLEAAHPVPAASSLLAGERLLSYLHALPAGEPLLLLLSGGASSVCEVLEEGWTLERLQAFTQQQLAGGASIAQINALRKRLSRIKGGKLWRYIGQRPLRCLLISDVPGDDPAVVASGPLFPVPATVTDFSWQCVARNQDLLAAFGQAALAQQWGPVQQMPVFLQGDAVTAAQACVEQLRSAPPGLYLWGAETTVVLPAHPGQGGRNQHFALAAALAMQPSDSFALLAVGSDGSDGVTDAAGAWVDSQTLVRGQQAQLDPQQCLAQADSARFLAASGDQIYTGPTGTNVMDLVVGWKC